MKRQHDVPASVEAIYEPAYVESGHINYPLNSPRTAHRARTKFSVTLNPTYTSFTSKAKAERVAKVISKALKGNTADI